MGSVICIRDRRFFFFQAEDGIRDFCLSRGLGDVYKRQGFYGTYTYTHSRVEDFNFEGRENEKDLSMPGSPEHTANASLYFEKGGLNLRLSYNFASDFIDEMGESTFYDRYLSLIHISEPTRQAEISYAVFCLKKKKK